MSVRVCGAGDLRDRERGGARGRTRDRGRAGCADALARQPGPVRRPRPAGHGGGPPRRARAGSSRPCPGVGPVDSVYYGDDQDGLRAAAESARGLGFSGKSALLAAAKSPSSTAPSRSSADPQREASCSARRCAASIFAAVAASCDHWGQEYCVPPSSRAARRAGEDRARGGRAEQTGVPRIAEHVGP